MSRKYVYIIIPVLLVGFYFYNNNNSSGTDNNSGYTNVNAEKFKSIIESGEGTLLDVRTPQEFNRGHIKGAGMLNFYDRDFRNQVLLLPKDMDIYLYCNTGNRSGRTAAFLAQQGYTNVYNLQRGIMEWHGMNYPVVASNNAEIDITDKVEIQEYENIIASGQPVLIDFYAPWCAPCRKMMPFIDSLVKAEKTYEVIKINVDASKDLVKTKNLTDVPYLVMYNKGAKVFEHNGYLSNTALLQAIESNFVD